jgi:glycine/D-amino acid oxidase-like deaminating enzyme
MAEISELTGRPVIIGGGAAGLATALALAPEPVVLLSKAPLGEGTSSAWAQGGMAATLSQDDDPQLHSKSTVCFTVAPTSSKVVKCPEDPNLVNDAVAVSVLSPLDFLQNFAAWTTTHPFEG